MSNLGVALAVLIAWSCGSPTGQVPPAPPAFEAPTNLGPSVNSDGFDGGPSMSADGLTLYFISDRAGSAGGDIWMATRETTAVAFARPTNLGPVVNSTQNEGAPDISADGLELFFDRDDGNIWRSSRPVTSDPFGKPAMLDLNHGPAAVDGHPAISADGFDLYFCSTRPGGSGGDDVWVARRAKRSDAFGAPRNLGSNVNSAVGDCEPSISDDGRLLFLALDRAGGSGSLDIWVSTRASSSVPFGKPSNLGPSVNSYYNDETPETSTDGSTLYFMTNRPGGSGFFDLWSAQRRPA